MTLAVNIAQGGSNNVTFRNRIINGAMVISQRNGTTDTSISAVQYAIDRWRGLQFTDGGMSIQQSSTAPAGFTNSMKCTITSADTSLAAGQLCGFNQFIEGYNTADLGWGTANASTVTLSFWVRSSLTGTFAGAFRNSATDRSYIFTYTISSANTWEQKTITVAGDTSGTWLTTNGTGIDVVWSLGVGSNYQSTAGSWQTTSAFATSGAVSVIGTLNATFYITGCQLEAGTTASPFEYRQYGTELALCQRYYENNYGVGYAIGSASSYPNNYGVFFQSFNTTNGQKHVYDWFKVPKRAVPTVTYYDFAGNAGKMSSIDLGGTNTNNVAIGYTPLNQNNLAAGATATWYGAGFFWVASAEL